MPRMTTEEMRYKLHQWFPNWSLDNRPDQQIRAMYHRESTKKARQIIEYYSSKQISDPTQGTLF